MPWDLGKGMNAELLDGWCNINLDILDVGVGSECVMCNLM